MTRRKESNLGRASPFGNRCEARINFALNLKKDNIVAILSAEYGLLLPDDEVEPVCARPVGTLTMF